MVRTSQRVVVLAVALAVFLGIFGLRLVTIYVDYLWFVALGRDTVFWTTLQYRLATVGAIAAVHVIGITPNVLVGLSFARRILQRFPAGAGREFGRGPFDPRTIFAGDDGPRPFGDLATALGGPLAARALIIGVRPVWIVVLSVVSSIVLAIGGGDAWETVARWWFASDFGTVDPIFGHDVAAYVFTVPLLRLMQSWIFDTLLIGSLAVVALYGLTLYAVDPSFQDVRFHFDNRARLIRTHLLSAGALIVAVMGLSLWLGTYDVLVTRSDRIVGATYTDIYARLPATRALALSTWLGSALLVATIFRRNFALLVPGVALFAAVLVLGRGVLPLLVQKLQVEPAEIQQERQYLAHNIEFTRRAYGLDLITEEVYPAEEAIRREDLQRARATLANIRLWDHRPLKDTYNQLQSIRPYYGFDDVDIDRYAELSTTPEAGASPVLRQVMLSARELSIDRLGAQAQTWVNQRLQYTHGYGVVMSPVNEVTPEGMPNFAVKDVPPTGGVPITRPEIYFGEQTSGYVVVNTKAEEFDYPKGDQNVFSNYTGGAGVRIGSYFRRLAIAWSLGDLNLLISSYLTPDSQLLFRRNIRERVRALAPFVKLDRDPYIVANDGRLTWVIDGYTTTDRYPYAQRTVERAGDTGAGLPSPSDASRAGSAGVRDLGLVPFTTSRSYNYIRNSVKITIDAYDGSVRFYLADPSDPIAATYARMFPGLIVPMTDMPLSLQAHIRYPEDLFRVQAQVLNTYHVQDPQVFYNSEDVWSGAAEVVGDRRQPMQPYYVTMRIPGQEREEFLLMLPFTPLNRDNMISWLAARSDRDQYGKLVLFKFPKDRLVYGPAQIDARIDQDPVVSSQLTLWNQQGSRVIRGHLLVIPIGVSTLYVEPIYLQAETSRMPELKRVVVASGNRVVMEPTLEEGLSKLFSGELGEPATSSVVVPLTPNRSASAPTASRATPVPTPVRAIPTVSPSVSGNGTVNRQSIRDARTAYDRAVDALKAGDFSRFGSEWRTLDEALREIERASGS